MKKLAIVCFGFVDDVVCGGIVNETLYDNEDDAIEALKKEVDEQYDEWKERELKEYRRIYPEYSDDCIVDQLIDLSSDILSDGGIGIVRNMTDGKNNQLEYRIDEIEF